MTLRCEWEGPALLFIGAHIKVQGWPWVRKVQQKGLPDRQNPKQPTQSDPGSFTQLLLQSGLVAKQPHTRPASGLRRGETAAFDLHATAMHAEQQVEILGVGGFTPFALRRNRPPSSKGTIRAHVLSHAVSEEEGRDAAAFTASDWRLPGLKFAWA